MRKIYTIRTTALEAFREFLHCGDDEDKPWINEANLLLTLQGVETYNVKAAFGTFGHGIIEEPTRYQTGYGYTDKEFSLTHEQVKPLMAYRAAHPLMIREICVSKLYVLKDFDLIVTGHIDGLEGNNVHDNKFKFSSFNVADFMDSFQWRGYLDMIGLDTFIYDFFSVKSFESIGDCAKARIGDCESMTMKRYVGMDEDIQTLMNEFSDYVQFKGLEKYLAIDSKKAQKIVSGNPALRKLIAL